MPTPPRAPGHVLRIGVVALAVVLGATLIFTAWAQWEGLAEEAHRLEQDPGKDLLRGLERDRETVALAPTRDAGFAALLASWSHAGLRYVALVSEDGTVIEEAGDGVHPKGTPLPPRSTWSVHDDRVWMVEAPRAEGSNVAGGSRDPEVRAPRRQPPRLVIEYVPERALALQATARRGLWLALWVAGVLVLGAGVYWRSSLAAEAAAARSAKQERLAALGQMSAVLAHELRNPLTSLKGHAQLLEEFLPEGRTQAKAARVVAEATRMETLISDLLEFVRAGRIQRRAVDLRALVEAAAHAASGAVPVAPAPGWTVDGPSVVLDVDPERLRQVVVNLIENGLQHGPPVQVQLVAGSGGVTIRVQDAGPGIPADDRERVFAPFHTTRTRGTGLGLAVARRIAEAHDGTLLVEDSEQGACFVLWLPRPT